MFIIIITIVSIIVVFIIVVIMLLSLLLYCCCCCYYCYYIIILICFVFLSLLFPFTFSAYIFLSPLLISFSVSFQGSSSSCCTESRVCRREAMGPVSRVLHFRGWFTRSKLSPPPPPPSLKARRPVHNMSQGHRVTLRCS